MCATNPGCPAAFCAPLPSYAEAIAIRNLIKQPILAGIRVKVSSRVVDLWDDDLGWGVWAGGDATVRDLSGRFGAEFTNSSTTVRTTAYLDGQLQAALTAGRPAVAPGDTTTIDVPSRIPAAVAAINDPKSARQMNFNDPAEIPGNLAGGIGADEVSCPVGAHPSSQNDARLVRGDGARHGQQGRDPDRRARPHVRGPRHHRPVPGRLRRSARTMRDVHPVAAGGVRRVRRHRLQGDLPGPQPSADHDRGAGRVGHAARAARAHRRPDRRPNRTVGTLGAAIRLVGGLHRHGSGETRPRGDRPGLRLARYAAPPGRISDQRGDGSGLPRSPSRRRR